MAVVLEAEGRVEMGVEYVEDVVRLEKAEEGIVMLRLVVRWMVRSPVKRFGMSSVSVVFEGVAWRRVMNLSWMGSGRVRPYCSVVKAAVKLALSRRFTEMVDPPTSRPLRVICWTPT